MVKRVNNKVGGRFWQQEKQRKKSNKCFFRRGDVLNLTEYF